MNVSGPGGGQAPKPATVAASDETVHQMLVATIIMAGFGIGAVIVAGMSKAAGNAVILLLVIMLIVQAVTRVGPFAAFVASHNLTLKGS